MTNNKKELITPIEFVEKKKRLIKPVEIVQDNTFDPESQIYLLLYISNDDLTKSYDVIKGRTKVYEHIKDLAKEIDCIKSKVVANGVDFKEAFSVHYFMKLMKEYFDDGFDINDYVDGDTTAEDNIGLSIDLE